METKQLTYSEKLKHPKWQKKRLEVLQRDEFSCKLCGSTEDELHVHHKEYKKGKQPWEYPLDNFETLCLHCHAVVENLKIYQAEPKPFVHRIIKKDSKELGAITLYVRISYANLEIVAIYDYYRSDNSLVLDISLTEGVIDGIKNLFQYPKKS